MAKLIINEVMDKPFKTPTPREKNYKFDKTFCSQCGRSFGPGNSGYSHCNSHKGK